MEIITTLLGIILEDIKKADTAKAESTQQTEEARRGLLWTHDRLGRLKH